MSSQTRLQHDPILLLRGDRLDLRPSWLSQRPHPFLLENLVFGYLTHNGFSDTAAVVARDVLAGTVQVSASDVEEVQRRQQVPLAASFDVHCCSQWTSI